MKYALTLLLSLAAGSAALAQSSTSAESSEPEIILDQYSSDIFPDYWRGGKTNAAAEPLYEGRQEEARQIVEKALAKYPASVLGPNLKKIYVVGGLSYSGVKAGGTNSRTDVYVVNSDIYKAAEFEKNVHAEFSSILLRNFPANLDKKAWEKINPKGFKYLGSGVQAIKEKKSSLQTVEEMNKHGFLHQYAQASMEEDFNSYAARMFMGSATLWDAIDQNPKMKAKADLVIAFYKKLSPSLDEEFFTALRNAAKQ